MRQRTNIHPIRDSAGVGDVLRNVRYRGQLYDIHSDARAGLTILPAASQTAQSIAGMMASRCPKVALYSMACSSAPLLELQRLAFE